MVHLLLFCFFKQKTAYEMRISDWSSDVCSSDLRTRHRRALQRRGKDQRRGVLRQRRLGAAAVRQGARPPRQSDDGQGQGHGGALVQGRRARTSYDLSFQPVRKIHHTASRHSTRSEEHTSELQSLMRISYAVFCLKKKKKKYKEKQ